MFRFDWMKRKMEDPKCPNCNSNEEVAGLWWSDTEWVCFKCGLEFDEREV